MTTGEASSKSNGKDFFVSYNRADRAWAEWIAWQLEEAGYATVLQAWDFGPGSNFVLEMDRAAKEAARTIAVLSPDYLTSVFTRPEWAAAFARDPTGASGTLVPARVRECTLTGLLSQIVYVDLVGQPEDVAKSTLLAGVNKASRRRPQTSPPFPGAPPRSVPQRPRFPGVLPSIWNVPHARNPNFTGREGLLAELHQILVGGGPVTQVITGLGGVGKTQLAIEHAYRYAAEYALVWWIRAEQAVTLAADYAALATAIGLSDQQVSDQTALVELVGQWLRQHRDWLLIFDNAPQPAEVRPYLPWLELGTY